MIDPNQKFHYSVVRPQNKFWDKIYPSVGEASRFYIDIAKRINPHRFCSRNEGEWSSPWIHEVPEQFKMLPYDPNFNKTYDEVTDGRALDIKRGIQAGKKYAVMYSGGMDSTCVMVALLKMLTKEELQSVVVCASIHSIIENPNFWRDYIFGQFKIFDSNNYLYDDYINMGYTPITADEGDCIFGTSIGLQLYHNYEYYVGLQHPAVQDNLMKLKYKICDNDVHYTRYKDILISYFSLNDPTNEEYNTKFGRLLYEKYHRNILTSAVPVYTLHDFFWWLIFNVKYLNCSIRGAIYWNETIPVGECINSIENWFNGPEYQYWSMNNNNNGLKIRKTLTTYKYAQRKYIYDFTKNDWYFYYKSKLESMGNLSVKGKNDIIKSFTNTFIGITDKYEYFCIKDIDSPLTNIRYKGVYHDGPEIQEFFEEKLMNYHIDWLND
jgi:hypothetical protein